MKKLNVALSSRFSQPMHPEVGKVLVRMAEDLEKGDRYSLRGLQIRILLVLYIPSANCAKKKLESTKQHNNAVDHKRNENVL